MQKIVCLVLMATLLSACNTMEGFGRDVEKVGNKIENAAKK